jgi:hypothetical protein
MLMSRTSMCDCQVTTVNQAFNGSDAQFLWQSRGMKEEEKTMNV